MRRLLRDVIDGDTVMSLSRPSRDFYLGRAVEAAPRLLGMILAKAAPDGIAAGRITEVEAYEGPQDRASHAFGGRRTPRTEVMFGPPGFAYVYFTYGMHWMFNVVVGPEDVPHVVLVRSLEPVCGAELMEKRRGGSLPLAEGPGRLTQALGISRQDNGKDLLASDLFVALPPKGLDDPVCHRVTGRIGIDNSGEARDYLWRFVEAR